MNSRNPQSGPARRPAPAEPATARMRPPSEDRILTEHGAVAHRFSAKLALQRAFVAAPTD